MERVRRWWVLARAAGLAALSVVGVVVVYLLCALVGSFVPVNGTAPSDGEIPVYVRANEVHADLLVPVRTAIVDWREVASPADTRSGDATCPYIAFGWGSKAFYLNVPDWSDLTVGIALRALAGVGGSTLHTCYVPEPAVGSDCRRVSLRPQAYAALVGYLRASARRDASGRFVSVGPTVRYCANDAFYEGVERYTLFRTCNSWANDALKAAGLPCCLWTPFAFSVVRRLP